MSNDTHTDHEDAAAFENEGGASDEANIIAIEEAAAAAAEDPTTTTWKPTKKWIAQLGGGVATIFASWIVTGAFDDVERGMAATLLVGLSASYFKSNDDTPGGVPSA